MTNGPKEMFRQELRRSGFTKSETEALLAQWDSRIRPQVKEMLSNIAIGTYILVTRGHSLTSDTLLENIDKLVTFSDDCLTKIRDNTADNGEIDVNNDQADGHVADGGAGGGGQQAGRPARGPGLQQNGGGPRVAAAGGQIPRRVIGPIPGQRNLQVQVQPVGPIYPPYPIQPPIPGRRNLIQPPMGHGGRPAHAPLIRPRQQQIQQYPPYPNPYGQMPGQGRLQ